MQPDFVKAFRQRLVRAQFTDISIYDNGNGTFDLDCRDSSGNYIRVHRMTKEKIINTPHLVWFD